jgi:DNA-binding MarR family transcriptional regulator
MQVLRKLEAGRGAEVCAGQVLETVPMVMRFLRGRMRSRRQNLTVPHFRTLIFIQRTPDAGLSALAEHIGLSLAAASRLVAVLVRRGLVVRETRVADRRSAVLMLTSRGRSLFDEAFRATRQTLADELQRLPPSELQTVSDSMEVLHRVFAQPPGRTGTKRPRRMRVVEGRR